MASTNRTIRVSDQLWSAAKAKAYKDRITVAEVVVAALEDYVEGENS